MNTHLKNVKLILRNGETQHLDNISVRGSTIRSFILPEALSLDSLLVDDRPKSNFSSKNDAIAAKSRGISTGRGRGRGRGRGSSSRRN